MSVPVDIFGLRGRFTVASRWCRTLFILSDDTIASGLPESGDESDLTDVVFSHQHDSYAIGFPIAMCTAGVSSELWPPPNGIDSSLKCATVGFAKLVSPTAAYFDNESAPVT